MSGRGSEGSDGGRGDCIPSLHTPFLQVHLCAQSDPQYPDWQVQMLGPVQLPRPLSHPELCMCALERRYTSKLRLCWLVATCMQTILLEPVTLSISKDKHYGSNTACTTVHCTCVLH